MLNKLLAPILLLALIAALVHGKLDLRRESSRLVRSALAGQYRVELSGEVYELYPPGGSGGQKSGWAAVTSSAGYAGPVVTLAVFDTEGVLLQGQVVSHGETTLFFNLAKPAELIRALAGDSCKRIAEGNYKLDTVSGASATTNAVLTGLERAASTVGQARFGFVPPKEEVRFEFGFAEIVVIVLFLAGYLAVRQKYVYKKQLRLATQATGLVVIGFWENSPISMAKITSFVMGYVPPVESGLYWYLLLGGFVLSILLTGRNIHCSHVCPFGAMQHFTGLIGGAKKTLPVRVALWSRRARNVLVLILLFYALYINNAGVSSYEPFGTAFTLNGTVLYWLLLVIILASALFLRNPWCHYYCPIQSVAELILAIRFRIEDVWHRVNR